MQQIDQTVVDAASSGSWVAIAALVVWALIAIAKSSWTPTSWTPPAHLRPLIALGLGEVYGVLEAVVGGMKWGPALVRGFMVAAFAIAGQEIVGKVKDAAGGGAGSSSGQLPPKDGGMWTGAGDGGSTHRAALALAMSLALALSGCGRLTPAQTATLGSAVPKIAGAGCEIVQSFTDASWVKFLCRVVEGGGISNMSTGAPGVDARPRVVEVEVLVPKEQADAFAAANHASQ